MQLSPGVRLGPYEILSLLGKGGMGEVYRARDARLDRTVAIKVLPPQLVDSPRRRQRFERESRAASRLSHPNICALYDVGEQDGLYYTVMEHLEGESLADALRRGPLPLALVLRYAVEVADALDHAHHHGIVHRDLKPANIMLARSAGPRAAAPQAKLLDFGVAQLRAPEDGDRTAVTSEATETNSLTDEGTILGTLPYMAPEQVEGRNTDGRTDIFALGAVIHEMATGRQAFEGTSHASLIAAILTHEPPPLSAARSGSDAIRTSAEELTPPLLDRIVARCLAKDPADRWQTAADLRQALKWVAEGQAQLDTRAPSAAPRLRERLLWAAAAVSLIAGLGFFVATRYAATLDRPFADATFKQITFRRGWTNEARFAADGQSIIYSSVWDGGPVQLFETRPSGPESRRLDPPSAGLASVSSSNELAILSGCRLDNGYCTGTLARKPAAGGAPRAVLEDVVNAAWTPDGRDLAVIHIVDGLYRVEFPIGKELYTSSGWLQGLSFSPRGDRLAFIEHPILADESGVLRIVDLAGRVTALSSGWKTIRGLVWTRGGEEIWFAGSQSGRTSSLYAAPMSGPVRKLFSAPADLTLWDISADGRLLVSSSSSPARGRIVWADRDRERELSWLDSSTVADLSPDGKTILFSEGGESVGAAPIVYVRNVDASDATRLGDGKALSLSPDGRWALAVVAEEQPHLVLLPTGAGHSRRLPLEGVTDVHRARWFPDGQRLMLVGAGKNNIPRSFLQDVATGKLIPWAEEGTMALLLSPDGRQVLTRDPFGRYAVRPLDGGGSTPLDEIQPDELPLRWSADGRSIYLRGSEEHVLRVHRYTLATGRRDFWRELAPRDSAGLLSVAPGAEVSITPDGQRFVFTYWVIVEDLFLVSGVKPGL